ncbi:hypothetical protein HK405_009005 [Cladochytrium tenue]|nr:hypothetical protein HK405_009005 [Cladochytrium tenue]
MRSSPGAAIAVAAAAVALLSSATTAAAQLLVPAAPAAAAAAAAAHHGSLAGSGDISAAIGRAVADADAGLAPLFEPDVADPSHVLPDRYIVVLKPEAASAEADVAAWLADIVGVCSAYIV